MELRRPKLVLSRHPRYVHPFKMLKNGSFPEFLTFFEFKIISKFVCLKRGITPPPRSHLRLFKYFCKKYSVTDKIPTASLANLKMERDNWSGSHSCHCDGMESGDPCTGCKKKTCIYDMGCDNV